MSNAISFADMLEHPHFEKGRLKVCEEAEPYAGMNMDRLHSYMENRGFVPTKFISDPEKRTKKQQLYNATSQEKKEARPIMWTKTVNGVKNVVIDPNANAYIYSSGGTLGCKATELPVDIRDHIQKEIKSLQKTDKLMFLSRQDQTHNPAGKVADRSDRSIGPVKALWHVTLSYVDKTNHLVVADTQHILEKHTVKETEEVDRVKKYRDVQDTVHKAMKSKVERLTGTKLKGVKPIEYRNTFLTYNPCGPISLLTMDCIVNNYPENKLDFTESKSVQEKMWAKVQRNGIVDKELEKKLEGALVSLCANNKYPKLCQQGCDTDTANTTGEPWDFRNVDMGYKPEHVLTEPEIYKCYVSEKFKYPDELEWSREPKSSYREQMARKIKNWKARGRRVEGDSDSDGNRSNKTNSDGDDNNSNSDSSSQKNPKKKSRRDMRREFKEEKQRYLDNKNATMPPDQLQAMEAGKKKSFEEHTSRAADSRQKLNTKNRELFNQSVNHTLREAERWRVETNERSRRENEARNRPRGSPSPTRRMGDEGRVYPARSPDRQTSSSRSQQQSQETRRYPVRECRMRSGTGTATNTAPPPPPAMPSSSSSYSGNGSGGRQRSDPTPSTSRGTGSSSSQAGPGTYYRYTPHGRR